MRVSILHDEALSTAQRAALRKAALAPLLRRCGDQLEIPARHGLALRLSDDQALRDLNRAFRSVDEATDVLAFSGEGSHVGDIAISVERALRQAEDGIAELRLLAVHGLLHCLGHDHAEPAEAALMTEQTRALLPGQLIPDLVSH